MPDNVIQLSIDLRVIDAGESISKLQQVNRELKNISATAEQTQRQRGFLGLRGQETQIQQQLVQVETIQRSVGIQRNQIPTDLGIGPGTVESVKNAVEVAQKEVADATKRATETYVRAITLPPLDLQRYIDQRHLISEPAYSAEASARSMQNQLRTAAFIPPTYAAVRGQDVEDPTKQQAVIQQTTDAYARGQAQRTAVAQAETQRRNEIARSEAVGYSSSIVEQSKIEEKQRQISLQSAQKYIDNEFKTRERSTQKIADLDLKREAQVKKQEEEIKNAQIKGAAAREEANYKIYQQALADHKNFERQRNVGGVTTMLPDDPGFGQAVTFSELSRLPNYRSFQAAEAERQAAESMRPSNQGNGGILSRIAGRLNRQGALEAQAAVVNTVQAMASGMDPMHVLMMESTQLAGAALQGGLFSLKDAWTAMISPIGQVAAGVAVVAGSLALVAYRGYQAGEAIKSIQSNFRTIGLGQENFATYGAISTQRSKLSKEFDSLGTSDLNSLTTAFNNAGPAVAKYGNELSRVAIGYSAVARVDPETAAGMFQKAAEGGATSLLKLSERLNVNGAYWREHIQALITAGKEEEAVKEITAELMKSFGAGIEATKTIDSIATSWGRLKASLNEGPGAFWTYLTTGHGPVDVSRLIPALPESTQRQQRIVTELTPEFKQREDIQSRYNELLEAEKRLHIEIGIAKSPVGEANKLPALEDELARQQQAIANFRTTRIPISAADEENHQTKMAQLQSEMSALEIAAQHDVSKRDEVLAKAKEIADEITAYENKAISERISGANKETAGKIQALLQYTQQAHEIQRANLATAMQESGLRRAEIGPQDNSAQLQAARGELQTLIANKAENSEIIAKKREIVDLTRQIRLETENINIAQIRQLDLVAQAREDYAAILRNKRDEAAVILNSPDRSAGEKENARTTGLQGYLAAQKQLTQLQQQSVELEGNFAQKRLQTASSYIGLKVQTGDLTAVEGIQSERMLTSQYIQEQITRLNSFKNTANLTPSEQVRVNSQLADLYEQDAQNQIDAQARVTHAIKAENDRRTENFKNFFSSVESGAADLLIAGLNRTQTRTEALRTLAQNLTSSFVHEMASMGSKFAGKGLAGLLNVKLEQGEDSSISSVLSKKLGSVLGLTTEVPKLDQAAVAQNMQKAGDVQKEAANIMLQAAQSLSTELKNFSLPQGTSSSSRIAEQNNVSASKIGSAFEGQYSTESSDRVERALDLIEQKESGGRNIMQQVIPTGGGYNPSVGRVTGPSTAQGYDQITNSTWRQFAPQAGIDLSVNPNAMSATREVQRNVARTIVTTDGLQHWAPYNKELRSALQAEGFPLSGPLNNGPASQAVVNSKSISKQKETLINDEDYVKTMQEYDPGYDPNKQYMPRIEDIGGSKGPKGYDYIFGKTIPRPEVDSEGNITKYSNGTLVKVDPSSVAQGVERGQQNATSQLQSLFEGQNTVTVDETSVARGVAQGQEQAAASTQNAIQQGITQAQQTNIQTTQQDSQQTQDNTQSSQELTSSVRELNSTIQSKGLSTPAISNDEMMAKPKEIAGASSAASSELKNVTSTASSASRGLDLFTSVAGLASSAALLFGKNLSPTAKGIIGGVGVASQVLSIGTKVASLFAAPATGGFSLAGLFAEQGAIVPSAEGGMEVKESSLSSSIKMGIRNLAQTNNTAMFKSAQLISSHGGNLGVNDGKGGRVAIVHPGELIVPATETRMILHAMNDNPPNTNLPVTNQIVNSAVGGMIVGSVPDYRSGVNTNRLDTKVPNISIPRINMPGRLSEGAGGSFMSGDTSFDNRSSESSNSLTANLNYRPTYHGYHPYKSRESIRGLMRSHGTEMMRYFEAEMATGKYKVR